MGLRILGFVVLIWLPAALYAQSAAQPCPAPSLNGGYFIPQRDSYDHQSQIAFGCDEGSKPAVEGWWAISICQGGKWLPEPQCINETACLPPKVPNAKYSEDQRSWHEQGTKIRIRCDSGYKLKDWDATAICSNGTWSSLPNCEMHALACREPPKIPHAVIIGQDYQEVFAADSKLQYECEDGYTAEGSEGSKVIFCLSGNWTEGPTCSRRTRQDTGHGGTADVGTSGGHTSTSRTPVGGRERETRPNTGGSTAGERDDRQPTEGRGTGQGTGRGDATAGGTVGGDTTSTGREIQPVGGGSSATSGVNVEDTQPSFIPVNQCGQHPTVAHGDVVEEGDDYLKYQCTAFYTQVGPEQVRCLKNRSWSELPTCREAFCVFNLSLFSRLGVTQRGTLYVKEGEMKWVTCDSTRSSQFFCTNERKPAYTACCDYYDRYYRRCYTYYA